jgi:hypothetical protein
MDPHPITARSFDAFASHRWQMHTGASKFCRVASCRVGGSALTLCRGQWPAADLVTAAIAPPDDERCAACAEAYVEQRFVERGLRELERGLRELERATAGDWPSACELTGGVE